MNITCRCLVLVSQSVTQKPRKEDLRELKSWRFPAGMPPDLPESLLLRCLFRKLVSIYPTMEVKSVGTFSVIWLKLATPPLPPQTQLDLEQNGRKWGLFLATTLLGEVGGWRDEPKAEQKIVLRSRVVHNNCLEGLFTQSQVLLSSIVWNLFRAIK